MLRASLAVVVLLGCRHAAHAQDNSPPPPGALGLAPGEAPGEPARIEALGTAAARELRAGPKRREQAVALLRAYRDATTEPHERAWADAELEALGPAGAVGREAPTRRVGLLVPLSGKLRPVGERLLEGALLAAERVVVEIADTQSDAARAADEADRLKDTYALVGPAARGELDAVRARQTSTPILPLIAGEALPSGVERVRSLLAAARRAAPHVRRFAVLAPTGGTADEMVAALRGGGSEVVIEARYAPGATQFSGPIADIAKAVPDAVLVADTADQLALIAPALAAAGLWPLPGPPPRTAGRGVLLLATAEGASPKLVEQAGRYLQGALLAPGFFPDPDDPTCGPFVARFTQAYGRAPGPWEAFAYEAVRAVAAARTPAEAAAWRSRWPVVYRVDGRDVRAVR